MRVVNSHIALFFGLLGFCLSPSITAEVRSHEFSSLIKPVKIDLKFENKNYLLITASQESADVVLGVYKKTGEKILEQSVSSYTGFDEILFLSREECADCYLLITGFEEIDKHSQTEIVITPLSEGKDLSSPDIEVLAAIKSASISYYEAEKEKSGSLEDAYQTLELIRLNKKYQQSHWYIHALNLFFETAFYHGKPKVAKSVLQEILSFNSNDRYYINANYNAAMFTTDLNEKIEHYEKGIALTGQNLFLKAKGNNFKAIELVREGRYKELVKPLREAYEYFALQNSVRNLLEPLHNLSLVNLNLGNNQRSLANAAELISLSEKFENSYLSTLGLYDMGRTYGQLNYRNLADNFLDKAINKNSKKISSTPSSRVLLQAYLSHEKAEIALDYGDYNQALFYVKSMEQYYRIVGYKNQVSDSFFLQAKIFLAQTDKNKAIKNIQESLDYDIKNNRHLATVEKYLLLSQIQQEEGAFLQAEVALESAFKNLKNTENINLHIDSYLRKIDLAIATNALTTAHATISEQEVYIIEKGSAINQVEYFYLKSKLKNLQEDYKSATTFIQTAKDIIDEHLQKVVRKDMRRSFFALYKKLYELDIQLSQKLHSNPKLTLKKSEEYKARTLKEELNTLKDNGDLPKELIQRRDTLLAQIQNNALLWHNGEEQTNNGEGVSVIRAAQKLSYDLESVETEIAEHRLKQQQYVAPTFELQAPQKDELVLSYFLGEEQSWLWVQAHDQLDVFELPSAELIEEQVEPVIQLISTAPAARKQSAWQTKKILRTASDVLLKPILPYLERGNIKTIRIVPDGILNSLPFATLYANEQQDYLGLNYAVSSAPSLEVMQTLRQKKKDKIDNKQKNQQGLQSLLMIAPEQTALADLQSNKKLVSSLENLESVKLRLLEGENAQKSNFLKQLKQDNDILYFSTHGLLNPEQPILTGLTLSDNNGEKELWLIPEISNSRVNASLVVLAACDTAQGKHIEGEGLMSLSRAFLEAGANEVLATLWQVNDEATASSMQAFFLSLLDKKEKKTKIMPSQALKEAQQAIHNHPEQDWEDPYYWAGFQLIGE